jgi:hypothetical protein
MQTIIMTVGTSLRTNGIGFKLLKEHQPTGGEYPGFSFTFFN